MPVKVIAPADLYLSALGDDVKAGQVVELDDADGESFVEQGWKRAGNRKPDRSAIRDLEPDEPESEDPAASAAESPEG